jgi:uncharacterized Zn finger protein (UPF0148 family)
MPDVYPRTRNGWTDTGRSLPETAEQKCPNCGSSRYYQTVSTEYCPDCGLFCDYWGDGTNEVYREMKRRRELQEESDREESWRAHIESGW